MSQFLNKVETQRRALYQNLTKFLKVTGCYVPAVENVFYLLMLGKCTWRTVMNESQDLEEFSGNYSMFWCVFLCASVIMTVFGEICLQKSLVVENELQIVLIFISLNCFKPLSQSILLLKILVNVFKMSD